MSPVQVFISTGEVSGDLQGALLVTALQHQAAAQGLNLEIIALGGDRMAAAGAQLLANTISIGAMGVVESLPFLLPTWRAQQQAKHQLLANPPAVLVLIDYFGPNLALGRYVRRRFPQLPIVYYIAPQMWVWNPWPGQTRQLAQMTDRLLAIFPGEARYFEAQGVAVDWVGHPLIDRVKKAPSRAEARRRWGLSATTPVIALFPASRRQELHYLLPAIFTAAQRLQAERPAVQFLVSLSLARYREAVVQAIADYGLQATLVEDEALAVMAAADLAITKSGTVNLEMALLNLPQVVLYRVNPLTMWLARRLYHFDIPHISPPNLVLEAGLIPELLQEAATPERIVAEARSLLDDADRRQALLDGYALLRGRLGEPGVCDRAAQAILTLATSSNA